MQILPKLRTRFGENIGVEIFIQPPHLADNNATFITTDAASGVSAFSVDNGTKFSVGEYVVVGNIGGEKTEIIRVHTATTPTATTLTLNSASGFAHNRGEKITAVPYNQAVIQRSTDGGLNYSDLITIDLRFSSTETYYNHTTGASTDYYRVKFSNSASSAVSQVADGVIATGFIENSAGAIIRDALITLGERIDGEVITKEFLLTALHEGRQDIDKHEAVERWSFRTVFDYDAGTVIPGINELTLPTNLRDADTFKNVLSVRIGKAKDSLEKVDKRTLNSYYKGIAKTTLNGSVSDVATTITLTDSGDFDASGAISIAAASISGEVDVVNYTANNKATNVLSGVDEIETGGHATGAVVWQGASFGVPLQYSVYEGKVVFSQPFDDASAGENIWLDYYKKLTRADSDGDLLDEPFAEIYKPYLRFRIKLRKNPQLVAETDTDFKLWMEKRNAQIKKEFIAQDIHIIPNVPDRGVMNP